MPETPKTIVDWAESLDTLIQQGISAVQSGDTDTMVKAQEDLEDFVNKSPDFADALDRQARLAIIHIDLGATAHAISELRARRDDVNRLVTTLTGVTTTANADAAALRLEKVRSAVAAATEAINAFKSVRETLKSGAADKKLANEIMAAIDSVQKIRNLIEVQS